MVTCNQCLYQPICNVYANMGVTDLPASDISPCELFKNKADFVEVVRCKDCKFSRKPKERYIYFEGVLLCESCEMSDDIYVVNSDDYCSCGKRRVNNE